VTGSCEHDNELKKGFIKRSVCVCVCVCVRARVCVIS